MAGSPDAARRGILCQPCHTRDSVATSAPVAGGLHQSALPLLARGRPVPCTLEPFLGRSPYATSRQAWARTGRGWCPSYLLDEDSGRPKYPPDVFDTPHTYPLAGYVAVKCSNPYYADLGGTCWELATEYSGDEPTPLGDQANPYALDINQGAPYLLDKEGVAVPMPCSKLRKREGVPRSLRDLVASKRRPSQHLVQRGGI